MADAHPSVPSSALDVLFRDARTHSAWQDRPVDPALLEQAYDIAKMGPTSMNTQPMRVIFVTSAEGKERLKPTLSPGNVDKTMSAPVTAIVAFDRAFPDTLPVLFPHFAAAPEMFRGNPALLEETAFRNSSLQAAYLIIALRAVGLDCGPMSGFDKDKVAAAFFPDSPWAANLLINIGYGKPDALFPRLPRLSFGEATRFV